MNHEDLVKIAQTEQENAAQYEHSIHVCVAASCLSSHADEVKAALEKEVQARGLEGHCKVKGVGCMGLCAAGPLASADKTTKMYQMLTAMDAGAILDNVIDNKPVPAAISLDPTMPFFTEQ